MNIKLAAFWNVHVRHANGGLLGFAATFSDGSSVMPLLWITSRQNKLPWRLWAWTINFYWIFLEQSFSIVVTINHSFAFVVHQASCFVFFHSFTASPFPRLLWNRCVRVCAWPWAWTGLAWTFLPNWIGRATWTWCFSHFFSGSRLHKISILLVIQSRKFKCISCWGSWFDGHFCSGVLGATFGDFPEFLTQLNDGWLVLPWPSCTVLESSCGSIVIWKPTDWHASVMAMEEYPCLNSAISLGLPTPYLSGTNVVFTSAEHLQPRN